MPGLGLTGDFQSLRWKTSTVSSLAINCKLISRTDFGFQLTFAVVRTSGRNFLKADIGSALQTLK